MMKAILAMQDADRGIGFEGELPWRLKGELAHFKQATQGGVLLMGRKTWESLPGVLPGREHVVISRSLAPVDLPAGVRLLAEPAEAIQQAKQDERTWWVIGGAVLFGELLPELQEVVLTRVFGDYEVDTYLPRFEQRFSCQRRSERKNNWQVESWLRNEA